MKAVYLNTCMHRQLKLPYCGTCNQLFIQVSTAPLETEFKNHVKALLDKKDGFPGGSDCEESACHAGDLGLITGLGRSPGGGHGNPFQYSCLENPTDRGAQQATVHVVAKSQDTAEWVAHS